MLIKTKWGEGSKERGHNLAQYYADLGLDRRRAAAAMGISVVRLWMLEIGEMVMEKESMWPAAFDAIAEAAKWAPAVTS